MSRYQALLTGQGYSTLPRMIVRDIEIVKKLLKRNRLVDEIMEDTGLTYEEVEDLCIES